MRERGEEVASLVVLVLAVGVRLFQVHQGYWIDEVVSVETARLPILDLLHRTGFYDVHPPLYYLLLSGYTKLLGESEVSTRALSLLFAAATFVLLWVWGNRRGRFVGFLAMTLLALSTFHAHYSIEVRSYSLLAFLSTAFLMQYETVAISAAPVGRRRYILLFLTEAALLVTHYYAALPVLAANLHFYSCRKHSPAKLYRWNLLQLATLAVALFWAPMFLVQYLHLPDEMFAHLRTERSVKQLALSLGLAPVHPSQIVAWSGSVLLLGAAGWTVVRDLVWGRHVSEREPTTEADPALSRHLLALFTAVLVAGLAAPMAAAVVMKTSDTTLSLLLQELPRCYLIFFGFVFLMFTATVLNQHAVTRGHGAEPTSFLVVAIILMLGVLLLLHQGFLPRNMIFLAPPLCLLAASAWRPSKLFAKIALVTLILGIAVPSLVAARATYEPRQDFRGVAGFIKEELSSIKGTGIANFVIPMWDRPGLEYYLGPGTANGIMTPRQIPPKSSLPDTVNLILTRRALEQRKVFVDFVSRSLSPEFELTMRAAFRGAYVAVYTRIRHGVSP